MPSRRNSVPLSGGVLGLFPELARGGGVERASRHVCVTLQALARAAGSEARFLSLNDPRGLHRVTVAGEEIVFEGFARAKGAFARRALAGRERSLVLAAHPNLAPLAAVVKRVHGAPSAVIAWGTEVWTPLSAYRRWALADAELPIAISTFTGAEMVRLQGVSRERLRFLPLALDPVFWEQSERTDALPLPARWPTGRVLLSVARLVRSEGQKGVDTVIRAMPALAAEFPDVQHVVIGDGDERPDHEALARSLGVADRVHFLGRLDPTSTDLLAAYRAAEIFVLPSAQEGFGIVFLEAMAFSKPVIGGAHGGTPDVIRHDETGLLTQYGDVPMLVNHIAGLLRDPVRAGTIGREARLSVQTQFTFPHLRVRFTRMVLEAAR